MDTPQRPTVAISLTVKNVAEALDFYTKAFGAKELYRMPRPDGSVFHAEFMIGNTHIYISDEDENWHASAMPEGAVASCLFGIGVEDCEAAYEKAAAAGAEILNPPTDYFWGMRSAMLKDPFGYRWSVGQQTEELTEEEIAKRAQALHGGE